MENARPWVCGSCTQPRSTPLGAPARRLYVWRLMSGLRVMA